MASVSVPAVVAEAEFTRDEVSKSSKSLLIIHDVVYDVTAFLREHPGGPEAIEEYLQSDATKAFEDVGHSSSARKIMAKYKVGVLCANDRAEK